MDFCFNWIQKALTSALGNQWESYEKMEESIDIFLWRIHGHLWGLNWKLWKNLQHQWDALEKLQKQRSCVGNQWHPTESERKSMEIHIEIHGFLCKSTVWLGKWRSLQNQPQTFAPQQLDKTTPSRNKQKVAGSIVNYGAQNVAPQKVLAGDR